MTYGGTMKKATAMFDINPQNWYELQLAVDRESSTQSSTDDSVGAVLEDNVPHTRMEYIHAPPLFLCLVSFLSHFGESWNLCSVVGVGIN